MTDLNFGNSRNLRSVSLLGLVDCIAPLQLLAASGPRQQHGWIRHHPALPEESVLSRHPPQNRRPKLLNLALSLLSPPLWPAPLKTPRMSGSSFGWRLFTRAFARAFARAFTSAFKKPFANALPASTEFQQQAMASSL